jgi:hypothetical protein
MKLGQRQAEEELSRSEAPHRAKFDASNDGKLLYRYQAEQHRGFIKLAELLKKQVKEADKAVRSEPVKSTEIKPASADQPAKSTPPIARNEAIEASTGNPSKGSNKVESERIKTPPVPRKGRKPRKHR